MYGSALCIPGAEMPERAFEQPFAVRYFDEQFRSQIAAGELVLNPFETLALPHLHGSVLDLGCGLGNLSLEAAKRGCRVTAVDGSRAAVQRVRREANRLGLRLRVVAADIGSFEIEEKYDCVVCIGLLMFFERPRALSLLRDVRGAVNAAGLAVVNALIEGTTFLGMFDPTRHYLFRPGEIEAAFVDWDVIHASNSEYPAPDGTAKRFTTLLARSR
jgi:tellurite methyltransferase